MANDRRDFFKAVGAVAAGAMISAPRTAQAAVAQDRYSAAYRSAVSLEGAAAEEVISADGGEIRGVVVNEPAVNNQVGKHLASIAYEEIALSLGANHSSAIYAWIQNTLNYSPVTRSGHVVAIDARGSARNQIRFTNGRITEVIFPALDARSRVPASIGLTFDPEILQPRQSPVTVQLAKRGKQKAWLSSNFRLNVDGLSEACTRVTAVESITVKQAYDYPPPSSSDSISPLPLEVSDLVFYCPEEFAEPFRAWARDFIVQGNRNERFATLEFLTPDLKTVLFTLLLSGLGIHACSLEGDDQKTASSRLVKVEVYCETVSLSVGPLIPS